MKIKKIVVLYLLFVFLITLVGVSHAAGGTTTLTREEKAGGMLVYGISDEPDNLDPWKTTRAISDNIMNYILEPLVVVDKNLNIVPSLAESWKVSEDGTVYTFKLKEGIKFHDGTPFNADAVIFTFKNAMKGNQAFAIESVRDIVKVDNYTVKFVLKSSSLAFLFNIADGGYFGIVSPTAYEKYKDRWGTDALVGAGPFKFEKWIRGQEIVLVRNDEYKHGPDFLDNKGPAYLEKIVFKLIPEPTILVGAVKSGDVDFTTYVPSIFVQELKKDSTIQFYSAPSCGTRFLVFNLQRELFQDKHIRLAIAHAIDKRPVADIAWSGVAIPTCSLLGPTTLGYYDVSDECIEYNPEKSKQFLADAGWKDLNGDGILEKNGKKFEINLLAYALSENSKSAVIIQDQLKNVGIKADVEALEKGAAIAKAQSGDFDIMEYGIWHTIGDAFLSYIAYSKNKGVGNMAFYENPEFDELLLKASMTANMKEYKEYVKKAQDILLKDLPYVPLVALTYSMMAKPRVGDFDIVAEYPYLQDWHARVIALEVYLKK